MPKLQGSIKKQLGLPQLDTNRTTSISVTPLSARRLPQNPAGQQITQALGILNRGVQQLNYAERRSDAVDRQNQAKLDRENEALESAQAQNKAIDFSIELNAAYDGSTGAFENKADMTPDEVSSVFKQEFTKFGSAYTDKHTQKAVNHVYNKARQNITSTHHGFVIDEMSKRKVNEVTSLGIKTITANPDSFDMNALQAQLRDLKLPANLRDSVEFSIITTAAQELGDAKVLDNLRGTRKDGNLKIGSTPKYAKALKEVTNSINLSNKRKIAEDEYDKYSTMLERALRSNITNTEILDSNITPQHKSTLLSHISKRQKQSRDMTGYIESKNANGDAPLANTAANRKTADIGYQADKKSLDAKGIEPETRDAMLIQTFESTGIIPPSFTAQVKADLSSADEEKQGYALKLINLTSESLDDGASKFTNDELLAATIYRYNGNPVEAIRIVEQGKNIDDNQRKSLKIIFKKDIDTDAILTELNNDKFDNNGWFDFSDLEVTSKLSNSFNKVFEHYYIATNGNAEAAQELAYNKISKDWSVSEINGIKRVQFMPPESVNFGQKNNDWLQHDFQLFSEKYGAKPSDFQLVTDVITVNSKNKKSWSVMKRDKYGMLTLLRDDDGNIVRYKPSINSYIKQLDELNNSDELSALKDENWKKAQRIRSIYQQRKKLEKSHPELFNTYGQQKY